MTITVSEDLSVGPKSAYRFCATVEGDTNQDRGGFGANEGTALIQLAKQFKQTLPVFLKSAAIERMAVR